MYYRLRVGRKRDREREGEEEKERGKRLLAKRTRQAN